MNEYDQLVWTTRTGFAISGQRSEYRDMSLMISSWLGNSGLVSRLTRFPEQPYIGTGKKTVGPLPHETSQVFSAWKTMCFPEISISGPGDVISRSQIQEVESVLEDDIIGVNVSHYISYYSGSFLLPPYSAFLQSQLNSGTMERLGRYMCSLGCTKTDVVVIDPPWPSKAVDRSKTYCTISLDMLLSNLSPLRDFLAWNGLVVVWVTNNPAITDFVISRLFPSLGVVPMTQWAWVKLTESFSPVIPWSNRERKTYERILVGIKNDFHYEFDSTRIDKFLFSKVPIHSLKPSLDTFIDELVPTKHVRPKFRLELFARNVKPGYLAWGNQALLFQHFSFWKQ